MKTRAWTRREWRLLREFIYRIGDSFFVPVRKSRLFHELFHRGCQGGVAGHDEVVCRPSGKYVFRGTVARLCRDLDMSACVELEGRRYFHCRRKPFEWKLNHALVIACAVTGLVCAIAALGWLGTRWQSTLARLAPGGTAAMGDAAGGTPVPENGGTAYTPSAAGPPVTDERVPFGPLPPGYVTHGAVFGPPKPPVFPPGGKTAFPASPE